MKDNEKLPSPIADYIKRRFRDDFLFELKGHRQANGIHQYTVEVTKDEYIHTLTFSEHGSLLREEAEPAFPEDERQGLAAAADVPE